MRAYYKDETFLVIIIMWIIAAIWVFSPSIDGVNINPFVTISVILGIVVYDKVDWDSSGFSYFPLTFLSFWAFAGYLITTVLIIAFFDISYDSIIQMAKAVVYYGAVSLATYIIELIVFTLRGKKFMKTVKIGDLYTERLDEDIFSSGGGGPLVFQHDTLWKVYEVNHDSGVVKMHDFYFPDHKIVITYAGLMDMKKERTPWIIRTDNYSDFVISVISRAEKESFDKVLLHRKIRNHIDK